MIFSILPQGAKSLGAPLPSGNPLCGGVLPDPTYRHPPKSEFTGPRVAEPQGEFPDSSADPRRVLNGANFQVEEQQQEACGRDRDSRDRSLGHRCSDCSVDDRRNRVGPGFGRLGNLDDDFRGDTEHESLPDRVGGRRRDDQQPQPLQGARQLDLAGRNYRRRRPQRLQHGERHGQLIRRTTAVPAGTCPPRLGLSTARWVSIWRTPSR